MPAGDDPHDDCVVESPATCGRTGACNGSGACAQHGAGTECRARTCAAAVETPANVCDGAGMCLPATVRTCAPLDCMGDRCAVGCSVSAPCGAGFECVASRCVGTGAALHWRFDEASGVAAVDSSGNGFDGAYIGEPSLPQPSANVPPSGFTNLRSRSFPASGRPGVYRGGLDRRLLPSNDLSFSIWYRATSAPRAGCELVNLNGDVMLRLSADDIEFDKRQSTIPGAIFAIARAQDLRSHLDGRWHHVAAVISTKGMDLYLDGVLRNHEGKTEPITFRSNPVLWVGREGSDKQPRLRGRARRLSHLHPRARRLRSRSAGARRALG